MARPAFDPLAPFFRSALQAAILARLVEPLGRWVPITELIEPARSHQAARLELQRLVDAGIVERDASVRPQRFRIPADAPLSRTLRDLVRKTVGVEPLLRTGLSAMPGVRAAAIHGSWATATVRPDSDIDLLLLIDDGFDRERLDLLEDNVRTLSGRELDVMVFSVKEARDRMRAGSGFLRTVCAGPMVDLVGDVRSELVA